MRDATAEDFRRLKRLQAEGAFRHAEGRAVVEGPRLVGEALAAGAIVRAFATSDGLAGAPALAVRLRALAADLRAAPKERLDAVADTRSPQGWMAEVRLPPAEAAVGDLWLGLDALQDPGNLGTLLRCAWSARAGVLLGAGCADPWGPKALRAGAGAQFHVPMRRSASLLSGLMELKAAGVRLFGTAPRARQTYLDADLRPPLCWILGSEGRGLDPEVAKICQENYRIDAPGGAESLNAAVSGAVLLFETLRQRRPRS